MTGHSALQKISAPIKTNPWLTLSVNAKITGSSGIRPRWANSHTRLIQYNNSGQRKPISSGLLESLRMPTIRPKACLLYTSRCV